MGRKANESSMEYRARLFESLIATIDKICTLKSSLRKSHVHRKAIPAIHTELNELNRRQSQIEMAIMSHSEGAPNGVRIAHPKFW